VYRSKEPFIIDNIENSCTEYPEKNEEENGIRHILLNVSEEIKHILPDTLKKNLQENEELCPVCHGLGIVKRNQPYGIKEDKKPSKVNWYDNEYFVWCPNCYFGVIEKCRYCGKIISKGRLKCDCKQQREIDKEEGRIKY